jgi:hypothetical protein
MSFRPEPEDDHLSVATAVVDVANEVHLAELGTMYPQHLVFHLTDSQIRCRYRTADQPFMGRLQDTFHRIVWRTPHWGKLAGGAMLDDMIAQCFSRFLRLNVPGQILPK